MRERDMKIVGRGLAIAGIVAVLSAVGYFGVKRLAVYAYHEFIYPIYNLPSEERVVKQVQKRYPEAVLLGHESYRKETPDMTDGEDDDVREWRPRSAAERSTDTQAWDPEEIRSAEDQFRNLSDGTLWPEDGEEGWDTIRFGNRDNGKGGDRP